MTHWRQIEDTLDCGTPQETWQAFIGHLRVRAAASEEIALGLERDAKDATERAAEFHEAAQEFHMVAKALEDAPLAFVAQRIEARSDETRNAAQPERREPDGEADAPKGRP